MGFCNIQCQRIETCNTKKTTEITTDALDHRMFTLTNKLFPIGLMWAVSATANSNISFRYQQRTKQ